MSSDTYRFAFTQVGQEHMGAVKQPLERAFGHIAVMTYWQPLERRGGCDV